MMQEDPEVGTLKAELLNIIKKYQDNQQAEVDVKPEEAHLSVAEISKCCLGSNKILKGHLDKVNSIHISGDPYAGEDNRCTIYELKIMTAVELQKVSRKLLGYEGINLTYCRFVNDSTLITGSDNIMV